MNNVEVLTQELLVEPHLRAKAPSAREARAVLALREAAKVLGRSPSIKEFAEIGEVHPEYGWPNPSRVRAWLGSNSWNTALERAGLQPCVADAIVRERIGSRFSEETLLKSLRLAAAALGTVPKFEQYVSWVRRPDVIAEHGLLPRAHRTFARAFGSWPKACAAAGLRESDGRGEAKPSRFTDEELLEWVTRAMKENAAASAAAYDKWRDVLLEDAIKAGTRIRVPAAQSIKKRFGGWRRARAAAELAQGDV